MLKKVYFALMFGGALTKCVMQLFITVYLLKDSR